MDRKFTSGASRDTDLGKLDYEGSLSPLVLKKYVEYMQRNNNTKSGVRKCDNWKGLFGEKHQEVCMKSLMRHTMDVWLFHKEFQGRDNMEDALCGVIFNASAILYKIEKDKLNK